VVTGDRFCWSFRQAEQDHISVGLFVWRTSPGVVRIRCASIVENGLPSASSCLQTSRRGYFYRCTIAATQLHCSMPLTTRITSIGVPRVCLHLQGGPKSDTPMGVNHRVDTDRDMSLNFYFLIEVEWMQCVLSPYFSGEQILIMF